jgi:hypothetical protein
VGAIVGLCMTMFMCHGKCVTNQNQPQVCDRLRPRWCSCSSLMFSSSAALSTRLMLALTASSGSGSAGSTSAALDRQSDPDMDPLCCC